MHFDMIYCVKCKNTLEVRMLGLTSGLGPPAIACRKCGTVTELGRKEWKAFGTSDRIKFLAVSIVEIVGLGLTGGIAGGFSYPMKGVPWADRSIQNPGLYAGLVLFAVLGVALQLYRVAASRKRTLSIPVAPFQQSWLDLQTDVQLKVVFVVFAVALVGGTLSSFASMNRSWWIAIVLAVLFWGLAMTLIMAWFARSRNRPRPATDTRRLAHPPSTLVSALVGMGICGGIAIASNVWPDDDRSATTWTTIVFIGFALFLLPMVADYFFARHEVSDAGMEYGRMSGRRASFRWSDVKRVRYVTGMKWFKIELQSGTTVRVSAFLMGLPEFARFLLPHVPAAAVDEPTRAVLQATAQGNPPSVWR
jgi:Bacterial PH domain